MSGPLYLSPTPLHPPQEYTKHVIYYWSKKHVAPVMRLCMCVRYCCESSLLTASSSSSSSSSFPYHFQWPAPHLPSSYHHTLCFCNSHWLHAMDTFVMGSNCMEEQYAHTSRPSIVHSLSTGKWVKCHLLQLNSIHWVTGFLSHLYYHILHM